MRAIGSCGDMPGMGRVMRSWCRTGTTGTSTAASAPTSRAQAPAASITSGVAMSPRGVVTPAISPLCTKMAVTGVSPMTSEPNCPIAAM